MGEITQSEDKIPELIKLVNSGDVNGVKTLLLTGSTKVDVCDENGMTALQHAAYKGQADLCKLLVDHGADVNSDSHEHRYSALHFAALSGNVEVTKLLLVSGARTYHTNTLNRTATQMAGFVGNHAVVSLINNYVCKEDVDYYTRLNGLEKEAKLPSEASLPLYNIIMQSNLHPVSITLNVRKSRALLNNLKKVSKVLTLMCEKEVKRPDNVNEVISIKYHYLSYVISTLDKEWDKYSDEDKEKDEESLFGSLIKKWLITSKTCRHEVLDNYIREALKAFRFHELPLFLQIVRTLSSSRVSDECALVTLSTAINGQRAFQDEKMCNACGTEKKELKSCSNCKITRYCDRVCQKLHWSSHKKFCKLINKTDSSEGKETEKKD